MKKSDVRLRYIGVVLVIVLALIHMVTIATDPGTTVHETLSHFDVFEYIIGSDVEPM